MHVPGPFRGIGISKHLGSPRIERFADPSGSDPPATADRQPLAFLFQFRIDLSTVDRVFVAFTAANCHTKPAAAEREKSGR
jgi:hypothetical protein